MTQTVELPLWLLLLILAFAAATALNSVLVPPVRWYLRRRMERAVARLNERLERPIEPFKLARRTDMIQRLIYDPAVIEAVQEHAAATGVREDVAHAQARRYAREIVPSFSTLAYFGFAARAARWLANAVYDVKVTSEDTALSAIPPDATVVFVMNHRSNMDYVLVTYLAAERSALSYAVGEWARIWPLRTLIRAMGAYFIRRRERNVLYRRVLARYVQLAAAGGVTQAVFPEGGLSLDGTVGEPRLGILSYILSGASEAGRDVWFVPIALNYDRVLEDRVLIETDARERRFRGSLRTALAFAGRWAWRRVRGKARRFGTAAVAFGAPLSLSGFLDRRTGEPVDALARELMARVRAAVPILPVPMVAAALLAGARTEAEVAAEVARLAELAARAGAPVHLADGDAGATATAGLAMLELRRLAVPDGPGGWQIAPGSERLLRFYAASIEAIQGARGARSDGT